ncbi:MAG TPA: lytic transglycosylase domain-containing protein [Puia sp.]|nr:lytic transglycosylase domain-containing protein [Puia sp.]
MKKFVAGYLKDNDQELAMVRGRSARPFTIIDSIMHAYDLPVELRYLAVIESDLRPMAISRVGAKGPWQLMAATARDLGLKVSRRADERTDYYKSTRAAALYLRDLHREFKDWLLVLAAYNAGPVPVERAIRMAGSRNFWVLSRYLPAETQQHVKRFIATAFYFVVNQPMDYPGPGNVARRSVGMKPAFRLTAFVPGASVTAARPVGLAGYMLGRSTLAGLVGGDQMDGRDRTAVLARLAGDAARREEPRCQLRFPVTGRVI